MRLDTNRPALLLTREAARSSMTKVTVAPVTSTIKGSSTEVAVGVKNGLDHAAVISIDNILTVPADRTGRLLGYLSTTQEGQLARAIVLAIALDVPLLQ